MRMGKKHSKLSSLEREKITVLLATGESLRAIARRLNRSDSTIRDEIKRNRFGEIYVGVHAQAKAEKRVVRARHRHPLKSEQSLRLKSRSFMHDG